VNRASIGSVLRVKPRRCSRTACSRTAVATLTYAYADSTAVLGPLAPFPEPHSYDLCEQHATRLTAPRGWVVVRVEGEPLESGQTGDDLEALANAVRETSEAERQAAAGGARSGLAGRRGHLRALPNRPS
jgi:hypothetical protein